MARRSSTIRFALGLAALATACGGDDLTLPNEGEPAELEILDGDGQNGTVGQALGESLVVRVLDRFGDPVPGVAVRWSAEGGGSVNPQESITDQQGRASTERTLGPQPATYFTIAMVEGLEPPATFTSTALTARLVITSQLPAIATSGVPLVPQPTLQLQDADGTPIASEGVVVTVQIASGGGSLTGSTSATSTAAGEVAFTDLAIRGEPGTRRLIFAAENFAPATSTPIALGVGVPASIEPVAGDDQTAPVGEPVPIPPAVRVRDEEGNPLSGIPVTFRVTEGGGSVSGGTPVTDRDGVAAVGAWRLGTSAGANELVAEVSGQDLSGSPVVFSATATSGGVSATESSVEASPATITASNGASAATITVRVRDAFGNPIEGVPVALAVDGSGNTLTQPAEPTDANGVASGRLSSTAAGARTVTATAGGVELAQGATVTVQPGPAAAGSSTATVPNGQAGVATTIEIHLKDALGNPASGQANAIGITIGGANNIGGIAAGDQGGGRYTASYTPEAAGTDQVAIRVSGAALAGSPFTSRVQAGPTSAAHSSADVPSSVSIFSTFVITITARDQFGNVVGRGGEPFELRIDGGDPLELTDNGDGTYSATIRSFTLSVDSHLVSVTLAGTAVAGSPYPMRVTFP
ncbi:MAG TPA: Ig-like domain-containing protein [Gemmatimonadales bacterium]|nr:Ig-like domain-containing protein [Gemmatimonadales bacterium]